MPRTPGLTPLLHICRSFAWELCFSSSTGQSFLVVVISCSTYTCSYSTKPIRCNSVKFICVFVGRHLPNVYSGIQRSPWEAIVPPGTFYWRSLHQIQFKFWIRRGTSSTHASRKIHFFTFQLVFFVALNCGKWLCWVINKEWSNVQMPWPTWWYR